MLYRHCPVDRDERIHADNWQDDPTEEDIGGSAQSSKHRQTWRKCTNMSYEMLNYGAKVCVGRKSGKQPKQETREQVIARNSFPGPDQNRYIDKFLAEMKKNETNDTN